MQVVIRPQYFYLFFFPHFVLWFLRLPSPLHDLREGEMVVVGIFKRESGVGFLVGQLIKLLSHDDSQFAPSDTYFVIFLYIMYVYHYKRRVQDIIFGILRNSM